MIQDLYAPADPQSVCFIHMLGPLFYIFVPSRHNLFNYLALVPLNYSTLVLSSQVVADVEHLYHPFTPDT